MTAISPKDTPHQRPKSEIAIILACLIGATVLLLWWQFNTIALAVIWLIFGLMFIASIPNVPSRKYVGKGVRVLTRAMFYLAVFILWWVLMGVRSNIDINRVENKLSNAVASVSLPSSIKLQTKYFTHVPGDIDQIEGADYYFNYQYSVSYNQAQQDILNSLKDSGYKIVSAKEYDATAQKYYLDYLGGVKGRVVLYINSLLSKDNIIQIDAEWNYANQDPAQGPFN